MTIISRKDAIAIGETKYYTGEPCSNGHLSYRYVQSGGCAECINGSRTLSPPNATELRIARLREIIATLEKQAEVEKKTAQEREIQLAKLAETRKSYIQNKILSDEARRIERHRIANEKREVLLANIERKSALSNFMKFKEPVLANHLEQAKALLIAYSIMRCPHITIADLWTNKPPKFQVLYEMKSHPDDIEPIRDQLRQWYSAESKVKPDLDAKLSQYVKPPREGSIKDIIS